LSVFAFAGSCFTDVSIHCVDYRLSNTSLITGETEDGFCVIVEDVMGFQGLNYTSTTRYCLTNYSPRTFGVLSTVDGYLGMGYLTNGEDRDRFDYWMKMVPREWPAVYGLQLKGELGESELHLGGCEHADDILWSEKQTNIDTEDILFVEAPLYRFSLCEEELLINSAFTVAQFVTYHNCLGLSQELFDQLLEWLDFCEEDSQQDLDSGNIICSFKGTSADIYLPSLSFKLSEDGEPLALSLSSLITSVTSKSDGLTRASLCIIRSKSFYSHDKEKIIFGRLPMENFYTAINAMEYRVGLYPYYHETNTTIDWHANCPAKKQCKGDETYDGSSNRCLDPTCRFFQYVDSDSKTCTLSVAFIAFTTVILMITSLIDCCITETRLRLDKQIPRTTTL